LCTKGIIHIGAHRCEEKEEYKSYKKILWIDGNDELCRQYPEIVQAIISDQDDKEIEFIITDNDAMSSSILELKDHLYEHPECHECRRLKSKSITLDTLLKCQGYANDDFDMLDMDIQGAELLALKGANKTLESINTIITEVSEKELYHNCVLLDELDKYLEKKGFIRVLKAMTTHGWGDAVYVRQSKLM